MFELLYKYQNTFEGVFDNFFSDSKLIPKGFVYYYYYYYQQH